MVVLGRAWLVFEEEALELGLATASVAISLAVCEPPAGIHSDAYFVAVSGCFFTGVTVAQLAALSGPRRRLLDAGRMRLMYAYSLCPLAAGLAVASLLW